MPSDNRLEVGSLVGIATQIMEVKCARCNYAYLVSGGMLLNPETELLCALCRWLKIIQQGQQAAMLPVAEVKNIAYGNEEIFDGNSYAKCGSD